MANLNIDGQMFKGPHRLGVAELPEAPALALVATESGEGIQILSVVEGDNIAKEISESKWNECWKKNGWNGIDVYIQLNDNASKRKILRKQIAEKRRESIKCEDFTIPNYE